MSRPFVLSMVMAAGLLAASPAAAQDEWKEEGGETAPPDNHPGKKQEERPDVDAAPKRFLADLKFGPAFSLSFNGVTEFGLQVNLGVALTHDMVTKGDAFYLTLSPYMLVGERLTLIAPLGAQYDLPLKMIPYEGISAYARVSVGYAYFKQVGAAFDNGVHGVAVQPSLGAKLSFLERFHVGLEPIGFDIVTILPPKSTNQPAATISSFQLYLFLGARF